MRARPSRQGRAGAGGSTAGLILATVLISLCFFPFAPECKALESGLVTRYATIIYDSEDDLLEFGRRLGGPGSVVSRSNPNAPAHIRESVDRIVFRVKALLDMHPAEMQFTVRLHPSARALGEAYRQAGAVGEAPVAFYSHRTRTVHMGPGSATDRIFAHEAAHAVINSYFGAPPPLQVQEILAQYVDRHLWDD